MDGQFSRTRPGKWNQGPTSESHAYGYLIMKWVVQESWMALGYGMYQIYLYRI